MLRVGLVSIDPNRKWIGGRYYLQHIVRAVASLPESEPIDLVDVWWQERSGDDPFAEVREIVGEPVVIAPPTKSFPRLLRRARRALHGWRDARDLFLDAQIDVLFPIAPCANPGIPLVFWMPDFQPWRMPELFPPDMRAWYDRHYSVNGAEAARIVVSGHEGLCDLGHFFPHLAPKARVLRFCSVPTSEWWQVDPAEAARKYALPETFLLLANQFSHHKNHLVAFEAVRLLRARGVPVVLACTGSTYGFRGNDYLDRIDAFLHQHNLNDAIRILNLIPRADQLALMRRAITLLQPSAFEGWSTAVEDAKTLGKPLIVSDIAVHREQTPSRATFVKVDDAAAWADAMESSWKTRTPGPHRDEESEGLAALEIAKRDVGRMFVAIMREAAGR